MEIINNYINGTFIPSTTGGVLPLINPATGKKYTTLPDSDQMDVRLAIEAAKKASSKWGAMDVQQRSVVLNKIADYLERDLEELAFAESTDTGKPLSIAKTIDIPRAVENFRFFAAGVLHFASESHLMGKKAVNYTVREPIGIVGCISPWNLPLYLFSWKIAPALATGNCVIAKPSELTPMTAHMLCKISQEAGLPPGVLNVVHGLGSKVGKAIVADPEISAISFTGGTHTGKDIASVAAPMFKKLSLELGGKNPNIIFEDCNFDEAVQITMKSSFSNQGQICLCGSRVFVQKSIYQKFKEVFVKKTLALKLGDPMNMKTDMGALISEDHLKKVIYYGKLAVEEGGKVLTGGNRLLMDDDLKEGYFYAPTIIEDLEYDCRTNREEIFGPIVTLTPFDSEEEVINYANSSTYGLSATIWTNNLSRAHRIAMEIKCGIIWVNTWLLRDLRTPFGGMKQSGVGREGGEEAFRFFTEPKNICIKI